MRFTTSDEVDVYRVQEGYPWYRRTWQAEWQECLWASRGYTKPTLLAGAWVRRHWGRSAEDRYLQFRVTVRWLTGYDDKWYRQRYTWNGIPRGYKKAVGDALHG